ncbi:hypothetical protein FRB95_003985 [Tulasnella sp. JGI-2019a]|nr:hypothetical protein FRB95_003985 [Tulasnella sp. JGI-2019a]
MLLNDFKPPRKTPRLGLAELLSPAPSNAKLAPPAQSSSTSNGAGAVPNNNAKPSSSSSNSSQPHPLHVSLTTDASDTGHLSVASPSPTHSPARVHAVMTSPSPPPQNPSNPLFTPPRLPYNPRRITPAVSVLRPLTQAELSTWVPQNPLRNIDKPSQRKAGCRRCLSVIREEDVGAVFKRG